MTATMEPHVGFTGTWQDDAACRTAPQLFEVTLCDQVGEEVDEPPYPTDAQSATCNTCPVRVECLETALRHQEPVGVWGGMSTYQRSLLVRIRSRKSCPGCGDKMIITQGEPPRQHEICLACGVSWFTVRDDDR
jgi:WhiB family redox-sensing transcriptional regulator